ncbi:MAG: tetratricopeptide repeat protein [Candidatus Solibacter usitatus]|nr:tetratricopeptide repeat protein [Candidatus Solibacter usitatus]
MRVRGGEFIQRRHQLDAGGREVNAMEKRVDFVMGSGNHARAYLHRTPADTLTQLPLGWYAEKSGYWAMNPGYDRPDHDGFRRPITYDCMFCHNAYPNVPPSQGKAVEESIYTGPLPEGIDCERCHGSGARHVDLAGRPGTAWDLVRRAIVNPARLSAGRQMEICMACHLETTSFPLPNAILRYGRGPFSFRPGEALADFILNFDHAPGTGREDKFEIVSSAFRLRRSACYVKSSGRMLCTTCHNPHSAPRGSDAVRHYDGVCRQCHSGPLSAATHVSPAGCVKCHMPKRRTDDVIHVSVTDHYIQRRKHAENLLAELTERQDVYRGEVVPYYPATLPRTPEGELYRAVAQVKQKSNLKAGIAQLTAAIARHAPQRAEWYQELAEALEKDGELPKALPWYREVVRRDPSSGAAWQKLGTALRRSSQYAEAVSALQRSIALSPRRALTWHELGLAWRSLGRTADALKALGKAVELDAELPEAHNNLGILRYSAGDAARAETSFREAIRIKPDYADGHGNLANLLAASGRPGEAQSEFERALRLQPNDAGARFNFAMLLGRVNRYHDAQRELEACLRADPAFADAHELLADLLLARNQAHEAATHYREAVRLRPESAGAGFGLGMALAATGDPGGAIPYLRKAAAGPDLEIRQRAVEALRQLGASSR